MLLWGDRWWIEGRSAPVAFGEFARAAETLLAEFGDARPARLRLVYQPAFLAAHGVACPNGNRSVLAQALGADHPALASDTLAWSHEPILGTQDRFATVLHCETEPGLHSLVDSLRDAGIKVEGAWPLATVLNFLPEDWPESGALTVVAIADRMTLVYRHTPEGCREVAATSGTAFVHAAEQAIQAARARSDVALEIAALDPAGHEIAASFETVEAPTLRVTAWSGLVAATRSLRAHHCTQLLPRAAWHHASRLVPVAAVVSLLVAAALGADLARTVWLQRDAAQADHATQKTLREEIAGLRSAVAEAFSLRAELSVPTPVPPSFAECLRTIGRKLPPQVVVTQLRADRDGFLVQGGIAAPGLNDIAWRDWRASWAQHASWALAEAPVNPPVADFELKGRWK